MQLVRATHLFSHNADIFTKRFYNVFRGRIKDDDADMGKFINEYSVTTTYVILKIYQNLQTL